ncbi:thrombospondin type 3 repeat-containing protein [Phytohabitans suffuscus]|uniref:YD repeat-containing protein n=1 Tax=Phytohabitans suffuscus TaxID=624315 RepID=A0A6F8YAN2_9ACTN|nr:thrombospondin type 3 repeat-containing protein [Phytohabitans suffuscus]BCB83011.1 hypothetical protein Psuf_003240 [Phytohabitans suffuscus]
MIIRTRRIVALAAAMVLPFLVAVPAVAEEEKPEERPRKSFVRLCDPTGCYIAWRVVDSDSDGVCDADELMAGTDPFDARSRPGLRQTVELATAEKLPSFRYGLGIFVAFPAELIELKEKATNLPVVGAFAMPERADTYTRLGVNLGQFDELKASVRRDGIAIGLGTRAQTAGEQPTIEITLFGGRYQGYERGETAQGSPAQYGGAVRTEPLWIWNDADFRVHYKDGSHDDVTLIPGGSSRQHYNQDGSKGTRTEHVHNESDGVDIDITYIYSPDGKLTKTIETKSRRNPDGSYDTLTEETTYIYGDDGKVTGTVHSESVVLVGSEHESAGQTVSQCDASGGNCTEVGSMTYHSDDDEPEDDPGHDDPGGHDDTTTEYVNPDYTDDAVTYVNTFSDVTRVLGANINVMRDWRPPYADKEPDLDRLSGIIYVDDTAGVYNTYFSEPKVTTAQPEYVPGMPNPGDRALPPVGGCGGLC